MPTLKPFIRAVLGMLIPALLSACVSLDGSPSAESSAPIRPSDQIAGVSADSEITSSAAEPPTVPTPALKGSTAADFEAAVALIRAERYADAEILLLGITSVQPELAGPWINLGQVYVALEAPEEARRAFEAAVTANPYNCTAHNELGLLSRVHGDFQGAERHYLNCIERVPGNGAAHLNLGILYELYLGRLPEALVSYRQYQTLAREPDKRVQGWVLDLERRLGV